MLNFAIERLSEYTSEQDISDVNNLLSELYGPLPRFITRDELDLSAIHNRIVVARKENIVGMGTLVIFPRFSLTSARVEDVIVKKEHRCQGIATAIMAEINRMALECGAKNLNLETDTYRPNAAAFYESLGYQRREKILFRKFIP